MKINRLVLLILFFIAIYLYIIAPNDYSLSMCYMSFILFLVSFLIIYSKRCKNNIICFDFIFSLTFFFTNYVYPLFYYPINPYFSLFGMEFPEEYITKATILATIGYISYCNGVILYKQIDSFNIKNIGYRFREHKSYTPIAIFMICLLIISLLSILASGIYDGNWGEGAFYKVIADIFIYYLLFVKFINEKSIKDFIRNNKLFLMLTLLYVIEITTIGNRGMFLRISLLSILLYSIFYKKIKAILFIPLIIVGMFLMYAVGTIRGEGSNRNLNDGDIPVILEVGRDLTINSRSLYVLMEYSDKHGHSYGKSWMMNILSTMPFAQGIFLNLTGYKEADINSAGLVTDLYFRDKNEKVIGLGTNLIGDIYLCFGLIGVVLFMYLLGKLISYSYYKGMLGDYRYLFLYALLFMDCIILTRSTYLTSLRPIVWCFGLYYFAKK